MLIRRLVPVALSAVLVFSAGAALAGGPDLSSDKSRYSYAVGLQMGQQLKQDLLEIDLDAFSAAVADAMAGKDPRLTTEEMQKAYQAMQLERARAMDRLAVTNLKEGEDYRASLRDKDGWKSTESGILYKVVKKGSGSRPSPQDQVTVHYRGTLVNGDEFDSSYARNQPATFGVTGVIQGWQEILQMMPEGSTWSVVIPSSLAYGPRGTHGIGPNSTLLFDIELIKIN
ncbi:MAG: FKBP-type peptidyl-prolyl cis-trans isomerase [Leptospirillia bacterium]